MDTALNMQPDESMNERLTKRCFLGLAEGKYLVSNTQHAPGVPVFAEYVAAAEKRETQWRRIVASRANGRHFFLFATCDGYAQMLQRFGFVSHLN